MNTKKVLFVIGLLLTVGFGQMANAATSFTDFVRFKLSNSDNTVSNYVVVGITTDPQDCAVLNEDFGTASTVPFAFVDDTRYSTYGATEISNIALGYKAGTYTDYTLTVDYIYGSASWTFRTMDDEVVTLSQGDSWNFTTTSGASVDDAWVVNPTEEEPSTEGGADEISYTNLANAGVAFLSNKTGATIDVSGCEGEGATYSGKIGYANKTNTFLYFTNVCGFSGVSADKFLRSVKVDYRSSNSNNIAVYGFSREIPADSANNQKLSANSNRLKNQGELLGTITSATDSITISQNYHYIVICGASTSRVDFDAIRLYWESAEGATFAVTGGGNVTGRDGINTVTMGAIEIGEERATEGSFAAGEEVSVYFTNASTASKKYVLTSYTIGSVTTAIPASDRTTDEVAVSFTMPEEPVAISATYARAYEVSITEPEHGTINVSGQQYILLDEQVTFSITPEDGYQISQYEYTTGGNTTTWNYSNVGENTETMEVVVTARGGVTFAASFDKLLTATVDPSVTHGTLALNNGSVFLNGNTVSFHAAPLAGYQLSGYVLDYESAEDVQVNFADLEKTDTAGEDYTFEIVDNVTIRATFNKFCMVTVGETTHGTIELPNGNEYKSGDEVVLTITPEAGYYLSAYILTNEDNETTTTEFVACEKRAAADYAFTVEETVVVTAIFLPYYTVTVNEVANGTIDIATLYYVPQATVTFMAQPATDYQLSAYRVDFENGESVSESYELGEVTGNQTITFTIVDNAEISVEFAKCLSVSFGAVSNGTVGLVSQQTIFAEGDEVTFYATPMFGYQIGGYRIEDNEGNILDEVTFDEGDTEYTFRQEFSFTITTGSTVYVDFIEYAEETSVTTMLIDTKEDENEISELSLVALDGNENQSANLFLVTKDDNIWMNIISSDLYEISFSEEGIVECSAVDYAAGAADGFYPITITALNPGETTMTITTPATAYYEEVSVDYTITVLGAYTRNISNFATICLPFDVQAENIKGVNVYNIFGVQLRNGVLVGIGLTDAIEDDGQLYAGKSYIVEPQEGATQMVMLYPYDAEMVDEPISTYGLVGNLSETPLTVPAGCYGFSQGLLRKVNGGSATVGQYKAYVDLTNVDNYNPDEAPKRFVFNYDFHDQGITTDIEDMNDANAINWNEPVYNILGIEVGQGTTGVLIQNGKKFFVE